MTIHTFAMLAIGFILGLLLMDPICHLGRTVTP